MQYKIEPIGAEFSNKAINQLSGNFGTVFVYDGESRGGNDIGYAELFANREDGAMVLADINDRDFKLMLYYNQRITSVSSFSQPSII